MKKWLKIALTIVTLLLTFTHCKKSNLAINKRPDLVGLWINDAEKIYLLIKDNGEGRYQECSNVKSSEDHCNIDYTGKARIKGNILHIGAFLKKIKIGDNPPNIDSDGNLSVLFDDKVFVGCRAPGITNITDITQHSAGLEMGYDIRLSFNPTYTTYYKPTSNANWDSLVGSTYLTGLLDSTEYEVKVKCNCSQNRESGFSKKKTFITK